MKLTVVTKAKLEKAIKREFPSMSIEEIRQAIKAMSRKWCTGQYKLSACDKVISEYYSKNYIIETMDNMIFWKSTNGIIHMITTDYVEFENLSLATTEDLAKIQLELMGYYNKPLSVEEEEAKEACEEEFQEFLGTENPIEMGHPYSIEYEEIYADSVFEDESDYEYEYGKRLPMSWEDFLQIKFDSQLCLEFLPSGARYIKLINGEIVNTTKLISYKDLLRDLKELNSPGLIGYSNIERPDFFECWNKYLKDNNL